MKEYIFSQEDLSYKLQQLSREEMKLRLLRDILADITICKLEGWDYITYLKELRAIPDEFICR